MTQTTNGAMTAFQFLETDKIDSSIQTFGMNDRWLAPVAVVDVKQGFDDRAWVNSLPTSLFAMRLAGAPVTCRWGKHSGKSSIKKSISFQLRGAPNAYTADGHIRFARLYMSDKLINRVAGEIWSSNTTQDRLREDLIFLDDPILEQCFTDYLDAAINHQSSLELEARAILITSRLLRAHHGDDSRKVPRVGGLAPWQLKRVCDAMEAHIESDIALEALARLAGISATHFSRAFKQSTGVPPFTWLLQRRIARAKELLIDPSMSLAEIALATGFAAQPQFTTAFRREVGVTPGAWRRKSLV